MFDIGWSELVLIAIVALIVVGPKELPALFKTVGQFMGRARGMAREFQRSMESAANESGLKEAADSLKTVDRFSSPGSMVRKGVADAVAGEKQTIFGDSSDADSKVGAAIPSAEEKTSSAEKTASVEEKPFSAEEQKNEAGISEK